jgi:hypothetical protein
LLLLLLLSCCCCYCCCRYCCCWFADCWLTGLPSFLNVGRRQAGPLVDGVGPQAAMQHISHLERNVEAPPVPVYFPHPALTHSASWHGTSR